MSLHNIESKAEYNAICLEMAKDVCTDALNYHDGDRSDAMDQILDYGLRENVDGCQYMIYTKYYSQILQFTDHPDQHFKEFGDHGNEQQNAFSSFYYDVSLLLSVAMDEAEEDYND